MDQSMQSMDMGGGNSNNSQGQAQLNPRKLFVGNMSWNITSEDLRAEFSKFGNVEDAIVLTDKFSGRSKGLGFVTMSTDEEAQAAIEGLNGVELDGRQIAVNVAQPPKPREERRSGGGGFNDRRGGGSAGGGFRGGSRSGGSSFNRDRGQRRDY